MAWGSWMHLGEGEGSFVIVQGEVFACIDKPYV